MSGSTKCAVCGAPDATKWTLHDGLNVGIVELCEVHEAPLRDVLKLVEESADTERRRRAASEKAKVEKTPRKLGKRGTFEPLDWTPPAT